MTTKEMAVSLLKQAKIVLKEAESVCEMGAWNLAVRRCQEVVELALKGALIYVGIQPPRLHDVSPMLEKYAERFPEEFARRIPQMALISASLEAKRGMSFYGDEKRGIPPEALFDVSDAEKAIQEAKFVLEQCEKLLAGGERWS
ncbi:MAG: HEPN domain-containing protein [Armatimonadetes bacterium]|nr:HEPN domain-containing protein [Armatimonadota bacterium]